MKRASLIALSLLAAACGADTLAPTVPTTSARPEVLGPNHDGEFYVVGLAGSTQAGADVQVSAGTDATVTADANGAFAARVSGEVDGTFVVTVDGVSVEAHALAPEKVNINLATARGLESLPLMGEVKSAHMAWYRNQRGLFAELEDITKVDGIGMGTVDAIRDYVEVDINLNAASVQDLLALPTIGDVRAEAIVAWRDTYGAFESPAEVMNVPGIDANEYEAIRPFVTAGETPSDFPGTDLVNINTATVDHLAKLPSIGSARAAAIVDFRNAQGPFVKKDAVMYVPGIGPAIFATIRDLITVGVLDANEGTFLGDGAWATGYDGQVTDSGVSEDLMVTAHYGTDHDELVLTFVGGGACVDTTSCAPVALKAILSDDVEGAFQVLGFLPAGDGLGEYTVAYTASNAGTVTEDGLELSFTAVRGLDTYSLDLTAGRVLQ